MTGGCLLGGRLFLSDLGTWSRWPLRAFSVCDVRLESPQVLVDALRGLPRAQLCSVRLVGLPYDGPEPPET
eukprot:568089-Amphidinium_carterae.1